MSLDRATNTRVDANPGWSRVWLLLLALAFVLWAPASAWAGVSQYDVGGGGALAAKAPPIVNTDPGGVPYSVAVSPDGKSVYVTNQIGNYTPGTISQYDVAADGKLSPKSPATVATGASPFGIAISPDGTSVYVTGYGNSTVSQYDVGAGGALQPKSPATVMVAGSLPYGVTVSPDGKSVYVADYAGLSVLQFDVGAGGVLSPKAPNATVGTGPNPEDIKVSPDGKNAYVTNSGATSVSQFDVNATTGALMPKTPPTVTTGGYAKGLVVSPDSQSVYVTSLDTTGPNTNPGAVSQFNVNAVSGALTPKAPATVATGIFPARIAITPGGGNVYVTNQTLGTVSQFDVGVGGGLSPKAPPTVAGGNLAFGVAVAPDGKSVYVAHRSSAVGGAAGPPSATVTTPADGASYPLGGVVNASYSCSPGANGGVLKAGAAGCSGTVANGSPIDSSSPGVHAFAVTAADTDGQTATVTVHYTVQGGAAGGPSVVVTTPADGASYTLAQIVNASYSCSPGANGGVLKAGAAGCSGPVANGSPIDTSSLGVHSFAVTATDTDGQTATVTSSYTVKRTAPPLAETVLSTTRPLASCGEPLRLLVRHRQGALRLTGMLGRSFRIADGRGELISVAVAGTTYSFSVKGKVLYRLKDVPGALRVQLNTSHRIELRSPQGRLLIAVGYSPLHPDLVVSKLEVCTFTTRRERTVGALGGRPPNGDVYLYTTAGQQIAGTVTITDGAKTISVHTNASGHATFKLAAGPDRPITLSYPGNANNTAVTLTVEIRNRGYGTIRLTTSHLPASGPAVFAGAVIGRDGKPSTFPVTLQYLDSHLRWRTVTRIHPTRPGHWDAAVTWPRTGHAGLTQIYYRVVVDNTPSMQINAALP